MAYDAGAAVGRLVLETKQWDASLNTAKLDVIAFGAVFSQMVKSMRANIGSLGLTMNTAMGTQAVASKAALRRQLQEEAAIRMGNIKATALTAKQAATLSLEQGKVVARQEAAIAIDSARTQNRATLAEAQHGYRMAEVEARKTAKGHVNAFDTIRRAGVSAYSSIGTAMSRLRYGAQLIATTFVVMAGVIAWQLKNLLGNFAEFEQRMRKATSVTKATESEFRAMSAEAETAAKTWGTPARDMADAFLFLGRAGLTASQQMSAMPAIAAASKAMLEDLEQTAEGTVNVMNAFNIKFDQTVHVTDMMTEAVNSSTMNLHEFLVSLSYAAKPAAAFNNTLQDTAAMIGIAANAGIRGSKAGTALRYAFTQLAAPTAAMRRELRELNISVYDMTGKMKPFVDIMEEVQNKLEGAGESARNYALKTLFGQRALSTMIALFDTGAEGVRRYSDQIKNASGVTETTAQKQMNAMKSQLERLRETWDALKRHIVETFAPEVGIAIGVVIAHVDKWTEAVDRNKAAVRSFVGDVVNMLISFGKLVAQGAMFAIIIRVLSGIVMILQAILSPLGAIIVAVFAAQVAWKNNFLWMRDVGQSVFAVLKNDALDFFITLVDGMSKATAFVVNSLAKMITKSKINTLTQSILTVMNTSYANDRVAEETQHKIYQILTKGGKQTLEEGIRESLESSRSMYESAWEYRMTQERGTAAPAKEYLHELLTQAKWAQTSADATIRDILTPTTGAVKAAFSDLGSAFADTFKMDIDFVKEKLMGLVPAGMLDPFLKALEEIKSMYGEIQDKIKAGVATPLSGGEGNAMGANTGDPEAAWGGAAWARYNSINSPEFWKRTRAVWRNVSAEYVLDWKTATDAVSQGFKTQQDIMVTGLEDIHNGFVDAFDGMMQKGGSFVGFMDDVFQSILASFRRMIATFLANSMYTAMFDGGKVNTVGLGTAGTSLWSNIKQLGGWGGTSGASLSSPSDSVLPTMNEAPDWGGGGAEKRVVVNVTNNGTPVTLKQVGNVASDGRQMVVNFVMEEAVSNPRFREVLAGGV